MSTLKPHLFSEMLDILAVLPSKRRHRYRPLQWDLGLPSMICAFAMSSEHAYKIVAYLLKNVLTDVSHSVAGPSASKHSLSFELSETHHIRALMRIAGQYCTSVSYRGPSKYLEWHKPIFDGLSMNETMSSTKALQNERVMKAVCKGRKVHNSITTPPSHYCLPLDLDWVGDGVIKELIVYPIVRLQPRGFEAWDGLKIERMEFPDGDGGIFRRDVLHPYRPQSAYLKFLCMNRRIVVETVIQMLKRHLFLKEIHFNHFEFNPKRLNFEETLKYIQKKIDQLWKFMVAHPGTNITVKCPRQDRLFNNDTDKLNTVQRLLSSEFVLEATQYHVICKLMKTHALKTPENVHLPLWPDLIVFDGTIMRKSALRSDLFIFEGKVAKKTTLKPHLFDEMMVTLIARAKERQRQDETWCWHFFLPVNVCALVISSTAGYNIVTYLLKNLLTKLVDYDGRVLFKGRKGVHPLCFYMKESIHIEALMRFAGKHCTSTFRNFDTENNVVIDWRSAIYEGLFENKSIESPDALIFRDFRNNNDNNNV